MRRGLCGGCHAVGGELPDRTGKAGSAAGGEAQVLQGEMRVQTFKLDRDRVRRLRRLSLRLTFRRGCVCTAIACALRPASRFLARSLF